MDRLHYVHGYGFALGNVPLRLDGDGEINYTKRLLRDTFNANAEALELARRELADTKAKLAAADDTQTWTLLAAEVERLRKEQNEVAVRELKEINAYMESKGFGESNPVRGRVRDRIEELTKPEPEQPDAFGLLHGNCHKEPGVRIAVKPILKPEPARKDYRAEANDALDQCNEWSSTKLLALLVELLDERLPR